MSDKIYNVALASDENYKIPLMVTIFSALENKNEGTNYNFVVMTPGDFSEKSIDDVKTLVDRYPGNKISFINMIDDYKDANLRIEHITTPAYYRLSLPELIKDDICLYLDVDIIVQKDLSEMFSIDMDAFYIAGVKAPGYYSSEEKMAYRAEYLEIPEFNQYVNTGVLVMNLGKMRTDNLKEEFDQCVRKGYDDQDQDIINKVCYGKIRILPPKYNSMTKYNNSNVDSYDSEEYDYLKKCFTKDEWIDSSKNPVIIHYADRIKPWENFGTDYSNLWWKYLYEMNSFYPCLDRVLQNATMAGLRQKEIDKELNEKLQITYKEKSELNEKLQITYKEKSEINAKLQVTYDEKAERGIIIKEQKEEIKKLKEKLKEKEQKISKLKDEKDNIKNSKDYKIGNSILKVPRKCKKIVKGK
ncbi:MAG: hypothetical protein K6F55_03220 [Eubacterium sp.]|nr:hypothetical protein [Eubacterium sp.]